MNTQYLRFTIAVVSCLSPAMAQDAASQANNPLANTTALNFQNYYIGEVDGTDTDANQFIVRYAAPFSIGESNWLMRASVPVVTNPVAPSFGHTSGLGDFNIFAAYLFPTQDPAVSYGIGPQLVAPTATDSALGGEQWQAGLAAVYFDGRSKKFQYGALVTYQAGFGDKNGRATSSFGAAQPFAFWQLGDGWYTGTAPLWTYNFENDTYAVPLGLRLGKVIKSGKTVYNMFVEPQYSVIKEGPGVPEWQIFFALNLQFGN